MRRLFNRILGTRTARIYGIFLVLVLVALLFQLGHFFEHIVQAGAWLFIQRESLYMTSVGMWLMDWLGYTLFPTESADRQALLGFEMLHLIGNTIFAVGVVGLAFFARVKRMFWAAGIQLFHLYEHISLTISAYYINKSIGMSTFFGMAVEPEVLLAYRVWWHFFFNAIPTILVLIVLWSLLRNVRRFS